MASRRSEDRAGRRVVGHSRSRAHLCLCCVLRTPGSPGQNRHRYPRATRPQRLGLRSPPRAAPTASGHQATALKGSLPNPTPSPFSDWAGVWRAHLGRRVHRDHLFVDQLVEHVAASASRGQEKQCAASLCAVANTTQPER